jgi:hypothetical protein
MSFATTCRASPTLYGGSLCRVGEGLKPSPTSFCSLIILPLRALRMSRLARHAGRPCQRLQAADLHMRPHHRLVFAVSYVIPAHAGIQYYVNDSDANSDSHGLSGYYPQASLRYQSGGKPPHSITGRHTGRPLPGLRKIMMCRVGAVREPPLRIHWLRASARDIFLASLRLGVYLSYPNTAAKNLLLSLSQKVQSCPASSS